MQPSKPHVSCSPEPYDTRHNRLGSCGASRMFLIPALFVVQNGGVGARWPAGRRRHDPPNAAAPGTRGRNVDRRISRGGSDLRQEKGAPRCLCSIMPSYPCLLYGALDMEKGIGSDGRVNTWVLWPIADRDGCHKKSQERQLSPCFCAQNENEYQAPMY